MTEDKAVEKIAAESGLDTVQPRRGHVVAHFMVGNTYPYTVNDWLADLKLAASYLLDGFVLNVGREEWQRDRVADCFKAAAQLPSTTPFKIFFSFDMSSIPGNTASDIELIKSYYRPHATNPRMMTYPATDKVIISTFAGENCTFGQGSMENGWAYFKRELNTIAPIYFIPSFFINPVRYGGVTAMDGAFNWNGGWPIELSPSSQRDQVQNARLDSDNIHLQNLSVGKTFMAAVSPWFFTHYGPDTWNKNWIYRGDDWLFVRRWEQLISMRDKVEIVQVISWNDYGESHYIGPIKGAQPNSQAWVDGYPHEAWLVLNSYFTAAFKKGIYPPVKKDQIFMWARPHSKNAVAPDRVPRPNNWELTDDKMWVIVFTTAPSKVELYTSENSKEVFEVGQGMTKLSRDLSVDAGMKATIVRGGNVVTTCNPIGFRFESRPGVYNFNAAVSMSY
ncbi:glycoside hydrolase [Coprinopsis marcescibilis]|uniref:Glycoside hydrolase n=1 Tax=Coprinopsis marcescibilis TaxID=230819 RepID=A0A5C3KNS9_COPMA|nr:glycoside hydrolase [Coprinopsis marcescibilis]